MVYFAFFHTHIVYGILLWGSAPRWKEVFIWQKKAIRVIAGLPPWYSTRGFFKKLNILTIPCIFIFYSILYVKTNLTDFPTVSMLHSHNTRNKLQLALPSIRLNKTYNAYRMQGLRFYNMLPLDFREFPLTKFKNILKKILIQSEGYTFDEVENSFTYLDITKYQI
jgi:hypothetical protein